MRSTRIRLPAPMFCILVLGLSACSDSIQTIEGDCGSLYDGEVCTWATLSGDQVLEFGATVPIRAIESAPLDLEMVFPPAPVAVIPLPDEVAQDYYLPSLCGALPRAARWQHEPLSYSSPPSRRQLAR